jgi:hypothetical protein
MTLNPRGYLRRLKSHTDDSWEKSFTRELSQHVRAENWDEARRVALELGAEAEKQKARSIISDAAWSLTRLGSFHRAFQLFAESRRKDGRDIPEWDGSDLAGRVLLVDPGAGHIARFMFWAPLLGAAGELAPRCIVLAEPRMVPLYGRTFPELEIRIGSETVETNEADFVASFEGLALHFWPEGPVQSVKLKPNPELAAEFRSRYQALSRRRPIIGIAWSSLNRNKDLPALPEWARLIANTPAMFISIQHGDVGADVSAFEALVPGRVISDPSVDQLVDLDRFAAQVAAVDAVISISNTSAHMASSLGVPTIVVLDDEFHLMWPARGDRTPWYTNTKLVRRAQRPWREVMETAGNLLRELLKSPSAAFDGAIDYGGELGL